LVKKEYGMIFKKKSSASGETRNVKDSPKGEPFAVDPQTITDWVEGVCKRFDLVYGFVAVPNEPQDVFLHVSSLPKDGERIVRPKAGWRTRVRYGRIADGRLKVVEIQFPDYAPGKA
jgi:cold shock CspA family protein